MPRHTPEEYLAAMVAVGDQRLRHTVIFEPQDGAVNQELVGHSYVLPDAIDGLRKIPGVDGGIVAAGSFLHAANVVEEILVDNPAALQGLRHHPEHDGVLDVAIPHTNWLVADRVAPEGYAQEPDIIRSWQAIGEVPLMRHVVLKLTDDTPESRVSQALGDLREVMGEVAARYTIIKPEVAHSIDRRKGDVLIVRTVWPDYDRYEHFEGTPWYTDVMHDLEGITDRRMDAMHTVDLPSQVLQRMRRIERASA
ncbi:MAG TPA: hypothetical protein VLG47_07580 [Candidatus Saccharimonadales bacterium]|nr:hypothetical protein [Candidatus Saccharimonadales bacterium]